MTLKEILSHEGSCLFYASKEGQRTHCVVEYDPLGDKTYEFKYIDGKWYPDLYGTRNKYAPVSLYAYAVLGFTISKHAPSGVVPIAYDTVDEKYR